MWSEHYDLADNGIRGASAVKPFTAVINSVTE
jgi:hypothetical protein